MPAGRKHQNVEFMNLLRNLTNHTTDANFAKACGQTQGNMSNYLRGRLVPKKRVLSSCLHNLMASQVYPVCEICKIPSSQSEIPTHSGIYIIFDSAGNALYVGQAKNFRTEVWQTLSRSIPVPIRLGPKLRKLKPRIRELASYYSLYQVDNARLRHNLEALLLRVFANHTHNTNLGSFNR